ncbi:Excinuclease ABC C subunit domain protein [Desulfofarcimen acetoxidans DSM 771]|uniref:Excinuclease ABC C subunit domain protein n=1 Tax=Desulfofarcimen acetoxidans (strain ATCC 49208 / DSM 771 / KCTC 5769 / VKM B-1644 / 5575) TaxID=485916 RepID=C8VZ03_DESAS|nr:Excinuclease ABC C subunit domain protein [Desulfofarcimen acetoxidans DSM 771]
MIYYVYILQCRDGSLYTGITDNPERRFNQHRQGSGSKYVRSRLPVKPVYILTCSNKSQALKMEIYIKKLSRQKKVELIENKFFLPKEV